MYIKRGFSGDYFFSKQSFLCEQEDEQLAQPVFLFLINRKVVKQTYKIAIEKINISINPIKTPQLFYSIISDNTL